MNKKRFRIDLLQPTGWDSKRTLMKTFSLKCAPIFVGATRKDISEMTDRKEPALEFEAKQKASKARQQFLDEVGRLRREEESSRAVPSSVEVLYIGPRTKEH